MCPVLLTFETCELRLDPNLYDLVLEQYTVVPRTDESFEIGLSSLVTFYQSSNNLGNLKVRTTFLL